MPWSISMSAVLSGSVPPPNADRFSTPTTSTRSCSPAAIACQARCTAEPPLAQAFSTVKIGGPEMPTRCSTRCASSDPP